MASRARVPVALGIIIVCGAALAGCRAPDAEEGQQTGGAPAGAALPVPQAAPGGITGMPDLPGPGAIGAPDPEQYLQLDGLVDSAGDRVASPQEHADESAGVRDDPAAGVAFSEPQAFPLEPGAHEAVAVLREYHTAINSGSLARAYRSWSDGGAASGQSPQQFADSFSGTAMQSVEYMTPGRIDAAAGSRYIEVPVAIEETRRDGSVRRYAGAYTLRRTVADDAGGEQRAWRIVSADLHEVRP